MKFIMKVIWCRFPKWFRHTRFSYQWLRYSGQGPKATT